MSGFRTVEFSNPRYEPEGLRFVTVESAALGRRGDVTAFAAGDVSNGAPLVILLHGVSASHWSWAFQGGAHRIARDLVRDGVIRPMVFALPSDGLRGDGSGYVAYGGDDAETWVVDEVPEAARLMFPGAGDGGICLGGLSMGGIGALRLAATHPGRYVAAAGTSSPTDLSWVRSLKDFAGKEAQLLDFIVAARDVMPPFRFDCGRDDKHIEANRALHDALLERGIEHEYAEFAGGHSWEYWSARLPEILTFFDRALQ
jgi:S-formylglutathione hydrolase FrmB